MSGYYSTSFHGVWDTAIIRKARGSKSWLGYGRILLKQIRKMDKANLDAWRKSGPLAWAQESYDITRDPSVRYCRINGITCSKKGWSRKLSVTYQAAHVGTIERRLMQAAVRLAAMVEDTIGQ